MKKALLVCAALFVLVLMWPAEKQKPQITVATAAAPPARSETVAPIEAPKPNLELLNRNGSYDEYSTTITGRIRNNTAHSYGYVQVTFNLYNKAGEQVGTALANVNNLEAGTVWKFKALGFARGNTFKLGDITGF